MLRRLVMRSVAWATNVAVVVVLCATCVADVSTFRERADVHHNCGDARPLKMICCSSQLREVEGLAPAGRAQLPAPAPAPPIAILDVPAPAVLPAGIAAVPRSIPVKPPGTATYLVVSSFRI